ncbi:hypothetical protein Kfla_4479 [Kribbella flavida DSM 17836]|uniref:Secreted protein n=1 Tax=Kribbella flavida (strain DSM 17836 / JCM 10339 / NBRC 14399) TaxID=479435 RepID=D2PWP0_KRIFD|nr:hypothetical protein [Kribbella flavida]ADB33509.1 hypothetical protein Kfla_4479 [Kribbella flavida DSM 17836]
MKIRTVVGSTLAVTALAVTPSAAHASAPAQTQPYQHLVTGKSWSSGGTYVSTGGDVTLNLTTLEKNTRVFVEQCEGSDLGDVQTFTKKAPSHTLATGLEKGTCFLILFAPQSGNGGYLVKGTLSY